MKVARTIAEVRQAVAAARGDATGPARYRVGFVPTMGALHDGHVAILRRAREDCGYVVASIFVNPRQFNDPKDLAAYPRPEQRDAEMARSADLDLLFVPPVSEIYPDDHATSVHVTGAASGFEGERRPGHFDGVATVCLKLFNIVAPDVVYFGQKDAQQVAVIGQLIRDMNLNLSLEIAPTVRDPDGLALSSRNARLSADERRRALAIPRALAQALAAHRRGEDPVTAARTALGDLDVEYVDVATFGGQPTLVIAARAGATRLIDNVPLERPELAGLDRLM
ncbi:MAG TPA: pantoate--beta-alanine ligase [Vicinamibacterales bacterium]|nr:pantoate--beta-alanine ligase [Vicinamibacterales bacterium]